MNDSYKISGEYLKASIEGIKDSLTDVKSDISGMKLDAKKTDEKIGFIVQRVSKLEYKSSFWGAVGGAITVALSALFKG